MKNPWCSSSELLTNPIIIFLWYVFAVDNCRRKAIYDNLKVLRKKDEIALKWLNSLTVLTSSWDKKLVARRRIDQRNCCSFKSHKALWSTGTFGGRGRADGRPRVRAFLGRMCRCILSSSRSCRLSCFARPSISLRRSSHCVELEDGLLIMSPPSDPDSSSPSTASLP